MEESSSFEMQSPLGNNYLTPWPVYQSEPSARQCRIVQPRPRSQHLIFLDLHAQSSRHRESRKRGSQYELGTVCAETFAVG
jgi:hypothetical protein